MFNLGLRKAPSLKRAKKTDPFATHRPILEALISETSGNVIEFGCGNSSTTLIKSILKESNRKFVSVESNLEWFCKFKPLEDDNHKLFHIPAGNEDTIETGQKWVDFISTNEFINNLSFEVCFIDQSPWTARTAVLNYFMKRSSYVMVHDVDYFPVNRLWGKVIRKIQLKNKELEKYEMDFSDVFNQYQVFYPPEECFASKTGPPTLLGSNLVDADVFERFRKI